MNSFQSATNQKRSTDLIKKLYHWGFALSCALGILLPAAQLFFEQRDGVWWGASIIDLLLVIGVSWVPANPNDWRGLHVLLDRVHLSFVLGVVAFLFWYLRARRGKK